MTAWSAGERADAHQITSVLREKFARPSKGVSREFVSLALAESNPRVVLELWGGGGGTQALRVAMPNARIISVENGSVCKSEWFVDRRGHRITKARLKRAHLIDCEEQGVEAFWGDLAKAVTEFAPDAVHADLCEQWSPSLARLLTKLRTDRLALTIMPERDGLGRLGLNNRLVALAALVAANTGMAPMSIASYERNDLGQDMALLIVRRVSRLALDTRSILRDLDASGYWPIRSHQKGAQPLRRLKRCMCGASYMGAGRAHCAPCTKERKARRKATADQAYRSAIKGAVLEVRAQRAAWRAARASNQSQEIAA